LQATEQDAQARVAALKLPPGVYVEFSGTAAEQRAAQTQTILYTAFAVL
jgi:multidrug efflux pump subunit AcrB